jgi:hypothetical protein
MCMANVLGRFLNPAVSISRASAVVERKPRNNQDIVKICIIDVAGILQGRNAWTIGRAVHLLPELLDAGLRVLKESVFRFGPPELESRYQSYFANRAGGYALALSGPILISWFALFPFKLAAIGPDSSRAPPTLVPSLLLSFVPAISILVLAAFFPRFYSRHWWGVNLLFMSAKVFSHEYLQGLFLWLHQSAPGVRQEGSDASPQAMLRMFVLENFYSTTTWALGLAFPTGQVSDVFFATLGLSIGFSKNAAICGSPAWGASLVTGSAPFAAAAGSGSRLLFAVLSANGLPAIFPHPQALTCTELRAFWQVVGWWFSCVLVLLREIGSRRAFLRSPAAGVRVSHLRAAARWPFGNQVMVQLLITWAFFLLVAPSLVWVAALQLRPVLK